MGSKDIQVMGVYPHDWVNKKFRRKRALKCVFVGESGRCETRILLPQKNAQKEMVEYRDGSYMFDRDAALLDTDNFLPMVMFQVGNPVALPVNKLSSDKFIEELRDLGIKTATQYNKAYKAKIVEDLLYYASSDVHEQIKQIWQFLVATIAILVVGLALIWYRLGGINARLFP